MPIARPAVGFGFLWLPAIAALTVVGYSQSSALEICEDLNGNSVVVGEMRYLTDDDGQNECYANAYWDGGEELSLGCGTADRAGAITGSGITTFIAFASHIDDDDSLEGSNVLFSLTISNTSGCSGCDADTVFSVTGASLRVNSSDPPGSCSGGSCTVSAGKSLAVTVGVAGNGYWEHHPVIQVSQGFNCPITGDIGCSQIGANLCDQLQNF